MNCKGQSDDFHVAVVSLQHRSRSSRHSGTSLLGFQCRSPTLALNGAHVRKSPSRNLSGHQAQQQSWHCSISSGTWYDLAACAIDNECSCSPSAVQGAATPQRALPLEPEAGAGCPEHQVSGVSCLGHEPKKTARGSHKSSHVTDHVVSKICSLVRITQGFKLNWRTLQIHV